MRNDGPSSSRSWRDNDDRLNGGDRYGRSPSKDSHRRGGRDDPGYREFDNYGRDISPPGRQYPNDYPQDRDRPGSSGPRTPPMYDEPGFSRWTPKDNRGPRNDRGRGGYDFNDRYNDHPRREEGRELNAYERRRDNGWASRRRTNPEDPPAQGSGVQNALPSSDDRPVEQNNLNQQNNGRSDNQQRKKHNKKNKNKNKTQDKQRGRDWRNDDSHLNNWQRRDNGVGSSTKNYPQQQTGRKQRYRSFSRSRSRSPAESYYSRRSSRGRSPTPEPRYRRRPDSRGPPPRSLSPVDRWSRNNRPKRGFTHSPSLSPPRRGHSPPFDDRPKRDSSPPPRYYSPQRPVRNAGPANYGWRKKASPSPSPPRRYPPSPGPPLRRNRSRGRSPSSVTNTSRSRSRSRSVSPHRNASKTVHRLPAVTSTDLRWGGGRISPPPPQSLQPPQRDQRNGGGPEKLTKAERKAQRRAEKLENMKAKKAEQERIAKMEKEIAERIEKAEALAGPRSMPPPFLPASASGPSLSPTALSPHQPTIGAGIKPKNAGFKPIGQPNASLKRFFPGDDDEEPELSLPPKPSAATIQSAMQSSTSQRQIASLPGQDTHPQRNGRFQPASRLDMGPQDPNNPFECDSRTPDWGLPPRPGQLEHIHGPPLTPSPAYHGLPSAHSDPGMTHPLPLPPHRLHNQIHDPNTPTMTRPPSPAQAEELYSIVSQVGEGTFGKVYKAKNTSTGKFVALKRIRMEAERDGFPVTAMREIKLLQSLRHDNVVRLYEMMVSNGSVFMVFEYMDHDLTGILSQTMFSFTDAHLKSLCQQMLCGLTYLHHKGVIHRDIKGSNILVNNKGELKLADFGLARFYQKRRRSDYTNRVITLWYRPPELLLGTTVYGPEVDMWSAGCIMLELFTKKPVFQGNDEIHQLDVIYGILGTPTPEQWPGVNGLPWNELVKPKRAIPNLFREFFAKYMSQAALDLAERLLAYDPAQRVTATQALDAPYFNQELPAAEPPVGLATVNGEWHELETKRERAKKRRRTEGGSTQ